MNSYVEVVEKCFFKFQLKRLYARINDEHAEWAVNSVVRIDNL